MMRGVIALGSLFEILLLPKRRIGSPIPVIDSGRPSSTI
jgi:hypothetical protein